MQIWSVHKGEQPWSHMTTQVELRKGWTIGTKLEQHQVREARAGELCCEEREVRTAILGNATRRSGR